LGILNFINISKASTYYGEYSYYVSWSLMKEINFFFESSLFLFPWQLQQSLSYRRCHGNQGAKNVKFTPNFTKFCSNVSCHIHI
jgi:hypothetical protein